MLNNNETILHWNNDGLLAEVVGFETDEVAYQAEGTSIFTYTGKNYIDFTGGIAVHACGHNHPAVIAAIQQQANFVLHTSDTMRHAPQLELANWLRTKFLEIIPGEPFTFLFKNSGSESIDATAKLALKATGRHKFVALEGAFHGRTLFATALSRSKQLHWNAYEPFLEPLRQNIVHVPRFDMSALEQIFAQHGSEIAAVFFEAQQGEGGYFPMPSTYAQKLRALTKHYQALLIADEIQSGCGRTGRWFGFQHLDITPDIVVFGKAIGGGLPLAGVATPQSLMNRWEVGEHGTTFGGNPLACAGGLAALKVIERDNLVERAATLGEVIKSKLCPIVGKHQVHDVRGNGLMLGVEFRNSNGIPVYAHVENIKQKCREQGLLLLSCGAKINNHTLDNSTLRLIPPLNISEQTLQQGLNILISAITAS